MVKPHAIRLQVIESPNVRDQIAFCAIHSFLVEVSMKLATALQTCRACMTATWSYHFWLLLLPANSE